jgi:hypothetical protein
MKTINQLIPPFASTLLTRLKISVGVSVVAMGITSTVLPQPASALPPEGNQSNQPIQDFLSPNERDTFSSGPGDGSFSVFNLIHQAQLGNLRDMGDYSQEQSKNISDAAARFRLEQQQRLGIQQGIGTQQQALPDQQVPTP